MNGISRNVTKEIFKELSFTSLKTQCCQSRRWGHLFSSVQQEHHSLLPSIPHRPTQLEQSMGEQRTWGARKEWAFKLGSFCHGKSAEKDKFLHRGSQVPKCPKQGSGCPTSVIKSITQLYWKAFPPTSILSQQEENKILISTSCNWM